MWPEGTNFAVLDEWMEKIEEAEERVVGGQECYRKSNYRFELIFAILGFVSAPSGVSSVTFIFY